MIKGKVSIIVNTWSPASKKYLDLCIESIRRLNYPQELLDIVLVGRKSYQPIYSGVATVAPDSDQFGNEFGQNFGVSHAASDSEHLFLINDDVFLTRNCLKNMVEIAADQDMLLVPISPCDNHWKYNLHFVFQHEGKFHSLTDRFYRYEDLSPYKDGLMQADSVYPQGVIITDKLCLFAVLIPRKTWALLGPMDENFNTGQSDFDYSIRARLAGVPRLVALNAVAWHFGGATSSDTLKDEQRKKNAEYFKTKWPGEALS